MSRLIEALRKAEEQKRKEEIKKQTADSASPSTTTDGGQTSSQKELQEPETEKQSIDFELEPIEEPAPEITQKVVAPDQEPEKQQETPDYEDTLELEADSPEKHQTREQASRNIDTEDALATKAPDQAEDKPEPDNAEQRSYTRRQTDTIQLEVLPENDDAVTRSRKPAWILLSFICLTIVGSYFFFLDSDKNRYPVNNYAQNRGFLDSQKTSTPQQTVSAANTSTDRVAAENNSLLETAQDLVENTVNSISDNTIETISAVNALLEDNSSASDPQEAEIANDDTLLQIKRPVLIKGPPHHSPLPRTMCVAVSEMPHAWNTRNC